MTFKLENTLQEIPSLLRTLLKSALDPSVIGIVSSRIGDNELGQHHIRIFQNGPDSQKKTVAIVDRTTDIGNAAENLVTSRFSFGGGSPYAPDIILVNEFIKSDFLVALTRAAINFTSSEKFNGINIDDLKNTDNGHDGADIIISTGKVVVIDIKKRSITTIHNKKARTLTFSSKGFHGFKS